MPYFPLIVVSLVALLALLKERNLYNPVLVFSGIWVLTMFAAGLRLWGLKAVSDYAYSLVLVGVVCFAVGAFLRDLFRPRLAPPVSDAPNYLFLILFYTPVVLFAMFLCYKSLLLLRHGVTMDVIRSNYDNVEAGLLIGNNRVFVFQNFVVDAAVFASVGLIPVIAAHQGGRKKSFVLAELVLLQLCFIFISGARAFMMMVVMSLAIFLMMNRSLARRFMGYAHKIPRGVLVALACVCVLVAWRVTTMRKADGRPPFYEVYRYVSLSMPLFDTHLEMMNSPGHVYTDGWTLLHGFVKAPFFFFRKITNIPWPAGLTEASKQVAANNDWYYVGGGYGGRGGFVNSFVTVFYYMMMDWGIVGLVFQAILYGYFCQTCYRHVRDAPTLRWKAVFLLMSIGLILSFVRFHFTAHRYVDGFVIIYFAFSNQRPFRVRPGPPSAVPGPDAVQSQA